MECVRVLPSGIRNRRRRARPEHALLLASPAVLVSATPEPEALPEKQGTPSVDAISHIAERLSLPAPCNPLPASPRSTGKHISGVWVLDSRPGFMEQIHSDDMFCFHPNAKGDSLQGVGRKRP